MALLKSIFVPMGSKMPSFVLKNPEGKEYTSESLYASEQCKGLIVAFLCNHCPYVIAIWDRFIQLANDVKELDVNTIVINPNIHPDYPKDSASEMQIMIEKHKMQFPYLVDEKQDVAKIFQAQCTPDIFFYNQNQKLIYHGRIDDNWEDETQVKKQELRNAVQNYVSDQKISKVQHPSMGCSIKWRK